MKKASDITLAESTFYVSEKKEIEESFSETINNKYYKTQLSDSSPLQKLVKLRKG